MFIGDVYKDLLGASFTYQKLFSFVQIEKNYVNSYLKGITAYFGDAAFGKMELS